MADDTPTTPADLGNISEADFLARPDWSVNPQNQVDPTTGIPYPNTWEKCRTCNVSLTYFLYRENFRWINEAFACRVDTPLSLAAKGGGNGGSNLDTDNSSQALDDLTGLSVPAPRCLYPLNGSGADLSGSIAEQEIYDVSTGSAAGLRYCVTNARGSQGTSGDVVLGLRTTSQHCYYSKTYDAVLHAADQLFFSCKYVLEWPQANTGIVLAQIENPGFVGGIGGTWRFGLASTQSGDVYGSEAQDWALGVWYRSETPTLIHPKTSGGNPIGITGGREFTLAFAQYETDTPGQYAVKFFVNGVQVGGEELIGGAPPSPLGTNARLMLGCDEDNPNISQRWVGGPMSSVYLTLDIDKDSDHAGIANAIYQRGAGLG